MIALILSATSARSSPAEYAWQVSRQKPTSPPPAPAPAPAPTASQSRPIASSVRAIALAPPAVFSISSGMGRSTRSTTFCQLANPSAGSTPFVTWPPCTISPLAPIDAAASSCWDRIFRLGIRIRLLVVATLTTYGACMYRSTPAAVNASRTSAGSPGSTGAFQP